MLGTILRPKLSDYAFDRQCAPRIRVEEQKMVQIFGSITLILMLKTNSQAIVPVFIDCRRTLPVLFAWSCTSING